MSGQRAKAQISRVTSVESQSAGAARLQMLKAAVQAKRGPKQSSGRHKAGVAASVANAFRESESPDKKKQKPCTRRTTFYRPTRVEGT